ncbi:hypothetical protein AVEN_21995-1 [Araneus ventricosus]|uniref:Secreted protein n=1 Tax=Araneus ventricosus TaxID=182803 RepID=A0A4Y2CMZ7_ARAVE|nr:hypothetical protein AVEN_21995-1 [Araneus ventricosus]
MVTSSLLQASTLVVSTLLCLLSSIYCTEEVNIPDQVFIVQTGVFPGETDIFGHPQPIQPHPSIDGLLPRPCSLVVRSRLWGRRAPGSRPDSTEDPP